MLKTIKTISHNRKLFPKAIIIAFILRVVVELITTANPLLTKAIVDTIQKWETHKTVFYILISIFLVATLFDQLLTKISNVYRSIFKEHFFAEKNKQAFRKIFWLDYQHYIDQWTWKLLKKVERWIESEWRIFEWIMQISSVAVIRFGTSLIAIFYSLPFAAAILVVWIMLLLLLAKITQKKSEPLYKQVKDIREDASRQESKMIMEKQLVNLSNKEQGELQKYDTILQPLKKLSRRADFWWWLPYDLMFILFRIVEWVWYLFIGRHIWNNAATFGDVIMLIGFVWQLRWPFDIIANAIADRSRQKARYESLQEVLTLDNSVVDWNSTLHITHWSILFDNIAFWYKQSEMVFNNFSLTIPWWTTCALVWHSWSWKSTLIKLLLRYYNLQEGNITIDSNNITAVTRKSMYKNIWYLSQEPSIFDWTIKENLLYGIEDNDISDTQLWQALTYAHIDAHIKQLSDWLNTEIWERGIKLSWWERQRLAIARIFLKNPSILILDEPTSALDSISEHAITSIMKKLFASRTVIIIAHRLQTVMHADNIVVLDKGNIVQQWTHEQLLNQDWIYKKLVNLQKGTIDE